MGSLKKTTAGSGVAVDGLNDLVKGLNDLANGKEVKKDLRAFHKGIALKVQGAARTEALRQTVQGRPVPKRTKGATGYVGGGTDRVAFLDVRKTNKFASNLEFGRKYQFVPRYTREQGNNLNFSENFTGVFIPAKDMKRRVYKEWVGTLWKETGKFPEGTKYGGYVAEKTIAKETPTLQEKYADDLTDLIKKSIKANK